MSEALAHAGHRCVDLGPVAAEVWPFAHCWQGWQGRGFANLLAMLPLGIAEGFLTCSLGLPKRPCLPHYFSNWHEGSAAPGKEPVAAQEPGVTDACPGMDWPTGQH